MQDGTEKLLKTVNYLVRLYDYCNAALFADELRRPVITVQRDERNRTYGWWSVKKVWKEDDKDEGEHELNMTAQQLNRPINQIAATMIHEMCHQYADVHNMQDTSRAGNYHNKLFKTIAEKHGLTVEYVRTIGWSQTELTDKTKVLIEEFVKNNPYNVIYRLPIIKGQCVKTSSTRKYVCPMCGNSIRATKVVNIICADCDVFMIEI